MKKALCLLLSVALLLCFCAGCAEPEEEDDRVTVWLVSEITHYGLNDQETFRQTFDYDSRGNETEFVSFTNGEESRRITREYDQQNRCIRNTISNNITYSFFYDDRGNLLGRDSLTPDGDVIETYFYEYDRNGNRILQGSRIRDAEQILYTYGYDTQGNKTEEIHYKNGQEDYRHTYSYDCNGNLLEQICWEDGQETFRNIYTYDQYGNQESYVNYRDGQERFCYTYTYDDDGKLTESAYHSNGQEPSHTVYTYDKHGNKIEQITTRNGKQTDRTVYEYTKIRVSTRRAEELQAD